MRFQATFYFHFFHLEQANWSLVIQLILRKLETATWGVVKTRVWSHRWRSCRYCCQRHYSIIIHIIYTVILENTKRTIEQHICVYKSKQYCITTHEWLCWKKKKCLFSQRIYTTFLHSYTVERQVVSSNQYLVK